jgi:eukaryotic-like serine/threonine-protein kinase
VRSSLADRLPERIISNVTHPSKHLTTPADRLSAALLGHYQIEREIGQGGMATVYLAHDVRHDRKVALKVLRPELSAILGGERFLHEIRTTANLQHPHILPLHDSGEADGIVYYVMPFVQGESLRDRLTREKQLPVEDAVRIAREVAEALDYAHRHGVVHRDIKPENILLHDGRAQVADFGIALAVSSAGGGTRMTETGMSLGTPHYMSPEQAMGEREISARSDIYALGCVLYEMLVGEPPFTGPTAQAIIARVVTEEPRSLTIQRRSIPPNVEAIVRKALEKLPADRFSSAAQMAAALANPELAGIPTASRTEPSQAQARRFAHQSGMRLAMAALLMLVVLTSAAAAWGWMREQPRAVFKHRIQLWQRSTPIGYLGRNLAIGAGGAVAFVDSVNGVSQIWIKERDQLEAVPVAGTVGATGPVFSPDGSWIAFVADSRLKKVPRLGGAATTIADSANQGLPAIAWLDDGTVLFNNLGFDLQAVNQDGGPQRRLFWVDSTQRGVVSIAGLPGGRGALFVACTFGCPEADLRAIDLRTGETRVLADDVLKGWYVPGDRVVFVRRDGGVFAGPFDLKKLEFRSAPVPVLEGVRAGTATADIELSRDGTLAYIRGGAGQVGGTPTELVWMTRSGEPTPVETGWSLVPAANWGMSLSPDGRRLALGIRTGTSEDVWVKELGGGPLTRLTFEGINTRAWWTADGVSVMYVSQKPGGNADIRIRRADGAGAEATLIDLTRPVWGIIATSDSGQYIVRSGAPGRDIGLARVGDTTFTPLIATVAYDEVAPALSPDGRWLAYVSNESGRNEIYVRPFPSVDAGRWQVSRSGGSEPLWSRDGRELFYRDGQGGFVAAAMAPGTAFTIGEQRVLFPTRGLAASVFHRSYDVTPDGQRFIFSRPVGEQVTESQPPVVYVENWLREISSGSRSR